MFWNGKPDSPVFPDLPNLVISRRILHKEHDFWEFSLGGFGKTPGGRRVRLGGVEWAGCWASCARGFGCVKKRARLANWAMLGHDKWAREETAGPCKIIGMERKEKAMGRL
jgi:hypothetical protein